MKYLTYSKYLNMKFEDLGFKRRDRNRFYKETDEAILELAFSHSSNGEPCVKYYYITIIISFPAVKAIANEIGCVVVDSFSCHLGYLTPISRFVEWRIHNDDTEEYVTKVTNEMYHLIKTYAMPYFDKYCKIENVIHDFENNEFPFFLNSQIIPVLYYIKGQKNIALQYMNHHLRILREKEKNTSTFSFKTQKTGDSEIASLFVKGHELSSYEEFFMKMKPLID